MLHTSKEQNIPSFWSKQQYFKILTLAFPMILANITTPLIGLVDTAVLGHMDGAFHLAGASIGALLLTQVYWICGFIRMSATGLSAQQKGANSILDSSRVLYQSQLIALLLGLAIVLLSGPMLMLGLALSSPEPEVSFAAAQYFNIRVFGAPAALLNLALIGWLIGQQRTKAIMYIQILANILNAGLDVWFVFGLDLGIEGVAYASLVAEYFILWASFTYALKVFPLKSPLTNWFKFAALKELLKMNSDMLVRNLALQACLAFIIVQGARLGAMTAATNAILMQFFTLIALGLDAIAYSIEALVGEHKGKNHSIATQHTVYRGVVTSSAFALIYSFIFVLFGEQIVNLLTDNVALRMHTERYMIIIWLLPIVAHWCFLYDGVFIGLTRSKAMRDSMLICSILVFFPVWWMAKQYENMALWSAMLAFLAARGITLGGYFVYLSRRSLLTD